MNRDKREPEYPTELESQFILRLPNEPAKVLREALRTGENVKNRLNIQVENDMRHGEVRFDDWVMHAKIVDLPTITESLKTIDNKSFYKTADICQMMVCKNEPDQSPSEEESPSKNKKRDPNKVDKKFLWPHGLTPPTKNVRKRRFRKTLKKKCVEAPEIEKEVKRLLRADNEAIKVSWEVIQEDDDQQLKDQDPVKTTTPRKSDKKHKKERKGKKDATKQTPKTKKKNNSSNLVDIFGGAVSDSDNELINVDTLDNTAFDIRPSSSKTSITGLGEATSKTDTFPIEYQFQNLNPYKGSSRKHTATSKSKTNNKPTSTITRPPVSSDDERDYQSHDMSKDNMTLRIENLRQELEELKQRRQRTQHEIAGMENLALRQRFQDILHTLNQDIMYKEMEHQGLITLQNSEDI